MTDVRNVRLSGDPDPGHAMPPTPEGWTMVLANRPGIVMPSYVRAADGALVRFNATVCAWSAFTAAGERFAGSGLSFTPTGMMQQIDYLAPVLALRSMSHPIAPWWRRVLAWRVWLSALRKGSLEP